MLLEFIEDGQIKLTDRGDTHILESIEKLKQQTRNEIYRANRKADVIKMLEKRFNDAI